MEIICGNILEKFNLDRDGTDIMQVQYCSIFFLLLQRCIEVKVLLFSCITVMGIRMTLQYLQGAVADIDDQDNIALKLSVKQSISKQKYDAFDALTFAAKAGDVDVVRNLLRRGTDINQADYDGRTAFAMVSFFFQHCKAHGTNF